MKKQRQIPNLKIPIFVSFLYLLIAVFVTWPLITNFTTSIPGVDEDSATHIWYLWWFKWALIEGNSALFKTDWIFHPQTIDRIFDVHTFVNAALSLPFQYLIGVVAASNFIFYLNFFLTGLGTFLLSKKLTTNNLAAAISGLIVVFMPYIWGQMLDNHTNLYTIWFIPFYFLFLIKTFEERKLVNPVLAGTFFGLQALNDLTLTTFMMFASALITVYYFLFYPEYFHRNSTLTFLGNILRLKPRHSLKNLNWETIRRLLLLVAIFLLVFLPLLIPVFQAISAGQDPGSSLHDQQVWSAQPQNFFNPSGNNPILKSYARIANVNSIEGTVYLGVVTSVLALIGIIYGISKQKDHKIKKRVGLWLFLFVSFLILSLGPCANWLGIKTSLSFCAGVPLPFVFFHQLPFIGGIQEPIRMHIYTMLSLAILAGFGVTTILQKLNTKAAGFLTVIIGGLILVEYYHPLPYTDLTPPQAYKEIAKDSTAGIAVLSLPVGWNNQSLNTGFSPIGSLQYFQAIHHKKAFRATVARIPNDNIFYYLDKPLFKYLTQPHARMPDQEDLNADLVSQTFKEMHVKYIVFHKDYYALENKNAGQSQNLIEEVLKAEKVYEDESTVTYKLIY